jgi:hypothetical protein
MYKGYTQGNVVILKEPLPVPNGTEVEVFVPHSKGKRRTGRKKLCVVGKTFGLIPADVTTVRAVLEEDLCATCGIPARGMVVAADDGDNPNFLAGLAHRRHAIEPFHEEAKGELGWDQHPGRLWVVTQFEFRVW